MVGAAAHGKELACFEEFHQLYQYDDGGRTWESLGRKLCGGAPQGKIATSGAKLEVRKSGDEVYFFEDAFHWDPVTDPVTGQCTGAKEVHKRTTKVLRDGQYHELVEVDGKPPQRKQKQRGRIHIAQVSQIPNNLKQPPFEDLGSTTLAGHQCQRFRARFGADHSTLNCVVKLPPSCKSSNYLLPLEQITPESGPARTEGRTMLLKTGRRGEVLKPGAIAAP